MIEVPYAHQREQTFEFGYFRKRIRQINILFIMCE